MFTGLLKALHDSCQRVDATGKQHDGEVVSLLYGKVLSVEKTRRWCFMVALERESVFLVASSELENIS